MNKKLAIKGHSTRGEEVIKLLEMMGGKNKYYYKCIEIRVGFTIGSDGSICKVTCNLYDEFRVFTLEEFLEKYPFKIGDKVKDCYRNPVTIKSMKWSDDFETMVYDFEGTEDVLCAEDLEMVDAELLRDNPVETKSYTGNLNDSKVIGNSMEASQFMQLGKTVAVCFNTANYENEVELQLGDYEIVVRDGKTYAVLKKPTYPKTYEECCEVLGIGSYFEPEIRNATTEECHKFTKLMRLKRCRDAYWKLYGEEMGLGKPWEPDWDNLSTNHEFIKISKRCFTY